MEYIYIHIYSDSVERTVLQKHVHYCTKLKAPEVDAKLERSARIPIRIYYAAGGCGIPAALFTA